MCQSEILITMCYCNSILLYVELNLQHIRSSVCHYIQIFNWIWSWYCHTIASITLFAWIINTFHMVLVSRYTTCLYIDIGRVLWKGGLINMRKVSSQNSRHFSPKLDFCQDFLKTKNIITAESVVHD